MAFWQVCTAHLTHESHWLHEDDEAKLRAKLSSVMIDYRDSGRAAIAPDCSPIFKDMCEVRCISVAYALPRTIEIVAPTPRVALSLTRAHRCSSGRWQHSGRPLPLDGFAPTQNELTPLQLAYIMDEMRGFPDEIGGDFTDLSAEAKANFHVAICGSGVNGLSVAGAPGTSRVSATFAPRC